MKYTGLMARALYDNSPESPEELAFRKGDILTVLEQNTGGLEGWWLCSLHGRQGIAPGNRLKLLVGPSSSLQVAEGAGMHSGFPRQEGLYQVPQGKEVYQVPQGKEVYQVPQGKEVYQVPPGQDVYQVPQSSVRASEGLPSKVVTPTRVGQSYAFDPSQRQQDLYDVPPIRTQGVYDVPLGKQLGPALTGQQRGPRFQGLYDIPPTMQGVYSVPPCRGSPAPQEGSYDFPQPHRSRPDDMYDVPPSSAPCPSAYAYRIPAAPNGGGGIYDVPPVQQLPCAQRDVYDIPRGGAPPPQSWDVTDSLQALSLSSSGPHPPAPKSRADRPLAEDGGHALCSPDSTQTDSPRPFPVPWGLEQEKAFGAAQEQCVKSWMEDYDYVHLQGKDEFERQQKELLEKESITKQGKIHMEQEQLNQLKKLEQEVIKPVEVTGPEENDVPSCVPQQPLPGSVPGHVPAVGGAPVCGRDRQLLHFYAEQCKAHFETLLSAVDAFFACVRGGQPPRVFVAHSKLVILSAHKLIFIGDTLSRQAASPEVAQRTLDGSNTLCQMLKAVVESTKMAALRYPNTAPLQEMVDRVALLSHHAQQFQAQILHMASL